MPTAVIILDRHVKPEDLGYIPSFLNDADPRSAREQLNANYQHGGGWLPQDGFELNEGTLSYPGDPDMNPIAVMLLRAEVVCMYPYGYVAVIQPDGSFEVARLD